MKNLELYKPINIALGRELISDRAKAKHEDQIKQIEQELDRLEDKYPWIYLAKDEIFLDKDDDIYYVQVFTHNTYRYQLLRDLKKIPVKVHGWKVNSYDNQF